MDNEFTAKELFEIAKRQKQILWIILISFLCMLFPPAILIVAIFQVFYIYKLAVAVRSSFAWGYIILSFLPLISLLALLSVNGKASRILKANGVKIGLMGVAKSDLERLGKGDYAEEIEIFS